MYCNNKWSEDAWQQYGLIMCVLQSHLSVWYTETTGSVLNSSPTKTSVAGKNTCLLNIDLNTLKYQCILLKGNRGVNCHFSVTGFRSLLTCWCYINLLCPSELPVSSSGVPWPFNWGLMVTLWQHFKTSCLCWFAGCLPCLWRWSRPEPARNWSQVRAEAATCSDWPSAAKFCHSSSHTCCTHPESWRSVNITICFRFFYNVDLESWHIWTVSLLFSGTVQQCQSSGMRSLWVRLLFISFYRFQ